MSEPDADQRVGFVRVIEVEVFDVSGARRAIVLNHHTSQTGAWTEDRVVRHAGKGNGQIDQTRNHEARSRTVDRSAALGDGVEIHDGDRERHANKGNPSLVCIETDQRADHHGSVPSTEPAINSGNPGRKNHAEYHRVSHRITVGRDELEW